MKISLLLTPRLVVILSACAITIVLLLLMLGFELGLRQAHEDYLAQAKARDVNSHYMPIYLYELQTNKKLVQNPFYK